MTLQPKPFLFFDAGGTLVFPEFEYFSTVALDFGIDLTPELLFDTHNKLIFKIDNRTRQTGHLADPYPDGYAYTLFSKLIQDPKALSKIVETLNIRNQKKSLWTSTYPWVGETISTLTNQGYRVSVISNADGRVEQILKDVNLDHHFEKIFDSSLVGVSKPDKKFFEIALNAHNLQPEKALYIGDTYYYDVWGANSAGLGCIHLDPLDLYQSWPGTHIPSIAQLPDWLSANMENPKNYDIHPAKNFPLTFENQTTK